MRPVVDHQGQVWFGEMGRNALAVFNPRTQTFTQTTPPQGANGIMGIEVAADDTIWFAEQNANYIGHYIPTSGQFQTYTLPTITTPSASDPGKTLNLPSAPNDIAIDTHGNVWFTETNADSIGMLDPHTGQFKHYQILAKKTVQTADPYSITIDPQGIIWFSEMSANQLGRLDPATGQILFYPYTGPSDPLMELASDSHGTIWSTTFNDSTLMRFDPTTKTFTRYLAPGAVDSSRAMTSGMYGLTTEDGAIWLTVSAANTIARFDTTTRRFTYYQVPTSGSLPLGVAISPDHSVWFTETASNKLGVLKP